MQQVTLVLVELLVGRAQLDLGELLRQRAILEPRAIPVLLVRPRLLEPRAILVTRVILVIRVIRDIQDRLAQHQLQEPLDILAQQAIQGIPVIPAILVIPAIPEWAQLVILGQMEHLRLQ